MGHGNNGTGNSGTGVHWDGGTMRQERNGTGEQWDRGAMGRGHIGAAPNENCRKGRLTFIATIAVTGQDCEHLFSA